MSERRSRAPVSPLPRQPATRPSAGPRPESLPALLESLTWIAAAGTVAEVGAAAVAGAAAITNARGSALATAHGHAAVEIVASVGYDCDSMRAGARIPLDAGLPLTEAVRTARAVVRGEPGAPAWVAVPVVADGLLGGLLVSLHPGTDPDVEALATLAASAGVALARAAVDAAGRRSLTAVTEPLREMPVSVPSWLRCAVSVQPAADDPSYPGGDVVVALPGDADDVAWVLVADVCGGGPAAAVAAVQVRHTAVAVVRDDMTPHEWLDAIDAALHRDPSADRFVTAVAVKLQRVGDAVEVSVSTAGHPPALLSHAGEVVSAGEPSLPLNLRLPGEVRRSSTNALTLARDDVLLLHTDGFVDRGTADRTDDLVELFSRATQLGDPDAIVDALVSAMDEAVEPPRDDVAVAVVVPRI